MKFIIWTLVYWGLDYTLRVIQYHYLGSGWEEKYSDNTRALASLTSCAIYIILYLLFIKNS